MSLLHTLKTQLLVSPISGCDKLVVAYSGGVDSHVLLHALYLLQQQSEQNFQLSAIHIHHGLSQHADEWQAHCRKVCEALSISFQTANVAVQNVPQQSLEALARKARYQKLTELAPANSQVLLAQHQDDQLETFLLQLKRGAGPKGLASMNPAWTENTTDKEVGFCRPLLSLSQQHIMDYALEHNLQWCEDESNQNTDFERNFLRHDVLPVLQSRWPELASSVSRSAQLCAQQQSLLDEVCREKLQQVRASTNSLSLEGLSKLDDPWLYQVVRFWLAELNIQSPSLNTLQHLREQVLEAADDAKPNLQWQDWQFRRFDQQLFVIKAKTMIEPQIIPWQGESQIELPQDLGSLRFEKTDNAQTNAIKLAPNAGNIELQFGGYSLRFKPKGAKHSKPLKQWFKEWKIPPWSRNQVVIVLQDKCPLALLINGKWQVSEGYKPVDNGALMIEFVESI